MTHLQRPKRSKFAPPRGAILYSHLERFRIVAKASHRDTRGLHSCTDVRLPPTLDYGRAPLQWGRAPPFPRIRPEGIFGSQSYQKGTSSRLLSRRKCFRAEYLRAVSRKAIARNPAYESRSS